MSHDNNWKCKKNDLGTTEWILSKDAYSPVLCQRTNVLHIISQIFYFFMITNISSLALSVSLLELVIECIFGSLEKNGSRNIQTALHYVWLWESIGQPPWPNCQDPNGTFWRSITYRKRGYSNTSNGWRPQIAKSCIDYVLLTDIKYIEISNLIHYSRNLNTNRI